MFVEVFEKTGIGKNDYGWLCITYTKQNDLKNLLIQPLLSLLNTIKAEKNIPLKIIKERFSHYKKYLYLNFNFQWEMRVIILLWE